MIQSGMGNDQSGPHRHGNDSGQPKILIGPRDEKGESASRKYQPPNRPQLSYPSQPFMQGWVSNLQVAGCSNGPSPQVYRPKQLCCLYSQQKPLCSQSHDWGCHQSRRSSRRWSQGTVGGSCVSGPFVVPRGDRTRAEESVGEEFAEDCECSTGPNAGSVWGGVTGAGDGVV
jgi:hypothetical protein